MPDFEPIDFDVYADPDGGIWEPDYGAEMLASWSVIGFTILLLAVVAVSLRSW